MNHSIREVFPETLEDREAQRTEGLSQANEALRQAQKLEALGQLTGGIVHDIQHYIGRHF